MLGVVLAAGDATRLPNKPLLPIKDGMIAIDSAINLCHKTGCSPIIVLQASNRIIEEVLRKRYFDCSSLRFATQPVALGVPNAIRCALVGIEIDSPVLITFCDNVYDEDERIVVQHCFKIADRTKKSYAATRLTTENNDLDRHNGDKWVGRSMAQHVNDKILAGWYLLSPNCVETIQDSNADMSSIDLLNAINAEPYFVDTKWFDIGTPQSYLHYLRSE